MKIIIQIPCYNEEETLPQTLADLPREIEGADVVEWLVVDDGSTDRTSDVARENGVDHVVRFSTNRGLAAAFREGVEAALDLGADIIVNTDADNQYPGSDIERLVRPILQGEADMTIGDRQIWKHPEFSFIKKCLQKLGSWVVSTFAHAKIPDVTCGFRAYSRDAALRLHVLSDYTYTHETIIQSGLHNLSVQSIPIQVNPMTRPSRLFRSVPTYVRHSAATILRIYTLYKSLKVFSILALIPFLGGMALGIRFLYFFFTGSPSGHIQSLILCAILLNLSFVLFLLGILADLIGFNRRLIEELLHRTKRAGLAADEPAQR